MRQLLSGIYPKDSIPVIGVHVVETLIHLLFSTECLDDSETAKRFLHLTHSVAPYCLGSNGICLQLLAHGTYRPSHYRDKDNSEQG